MARPIALGRSDFLQVQLDRDFYVDKSRFVADVLQDRSQVVLLPRPRRFGKTLNLSTLRHFVERPVGAGTDRDEVRRAFAGLEVEKSGDEVWGYFQKHPVIFLTFKDVKGGDWSPGGTFAELIAREAQRVSPLTDPVLTPEDRRRQKALLRGSSSLSLLADALLLLSQWLHRATGEKAFILIDEYDTPIHDAFGDEKRYDEVVGFFRKFFSAGLKDNPHLEKGVLTGILRVAKESMFSGLNNLQVYTLLREAYATCFGFTEGEVDRICADFELSAAQRDELRSWYNGYRFGGHVIYNPWSVLSFIKHKRERPRPYWVNTGGDALIRKLLIELDLETQNDVEALLRGESIEKPLDEHTVFRDLELKSEAVFSFLVMAGYLRADELVRVEEDGPEWWKLSVPNREVSTAYKGLFRDWLTTSLGGEPRQRALCRAILAGDAPAVEEHLGTILERTLSYHDTAGRAKEIVYQAFVAGLLVALDATHQVRSNRESGLGRCDVLITPRKTGEPGVALELKVLKASETMEGALAAALAQVREKNYAAELRAAGADPVVELAAVFDKKAVRVARGA
ncbi:MAG: AAA family ATPase [Planctomycetes bacterium]|nr:AAA family ATPase [Planctomycetota bacterium]